MVPSLKMDQNNGHFAALAIALKRASDFPYSPSPSDLAPATQARTHPV